MSTTRRAPASPEAEFVDDLVSGISSDNDRLSGINLSPEEFAARRLKVLVMDGETKEKKFVPFVYKPAQRDLIANLTNRNLILKARQLGMTTAIQALIYQRAVSGRITALTLSKDDDSTQTVRRMATAFAENDTVPIRRSADNARLTVYENTGSEVLIATAGNHTSGRSATLSYLHGSEAAYYSNLGGILTGAMQAGNPTVILESTPNGAQGEFYNLCMDALDGGSPWKLHFYPWWWEPDYRLPLDEGEVLSYTDDELALVVAHKLTPEQIKFRRAKQRELKSQFVQEYAEDPLTCFLRSGFGYFGDLSLCFTAPADATFDPSHQYVGGLDFGQTNDFTALSIQDVMTGNEVALLRVNQMSWGDMRNLVVQYCQQWHVNTLWAEKNSMGTTNTEELRKELAKEGVQTAVREFLTTNESKSSAMSAMHEALHGRSMRLLPDAIARREMTAFAAYQLPSGAWRLSAPDKEHDDTVIARALGLYAVTHRGFGSEDWERFGSGKVDPTRLGMWGRKEQENKTA